MKRVIIESPYAGDIERNVAYARRCLADSLGRGEAPFASHLLYTQPGVLRDDDPHERQQGIQAGFTWHEAAELCALYVDYGVTSGMLAGMDNANRNGLPLVLRLIGKNDSPRAARLRPELSVARHITPEIVRHVTALGDALSAAQSAQSGAPSATE